MRKCHQNTSFTHEILHWFPVLSKNNVVVFLNLKITNTIETCLMLNLSVLHVSFITSAKSLCYKALVMLDCLIKPKFLAYKLYINS